MMSKMPLKLQLSRVPNLDWARNLRWLDRAHYRVLVGRGGIEGDFEATFMSAGVKIGHSTLREWGVAAE